MKTFLLVPFTLLAATAAAFAQGPLTPPPGAPAPVMKSLDQVEARTPLVAGQPGVAIDANGLLTISQPGSYYLTGNRTVSTGNAIYISSSNVTLDLNGFTLSSTSPDNFGSGVLIGNQLRNIAISNGHIQSSIVNSGGNYAGNGFNSGITYLSNRPSNARVSNVSVSGCKYDGIDLGGKFGSSNTIVDCVVRTVGRTGIAANVIRGCSATECGSSAIFADAVSDCTAKSTGGSGITAEVVQNCHAVGANKGINADRSVTNSYGEALAADAGISCATGTASFSQGKSASGFAIFSSIAIGCTTGGGTISSAQKHLGTP